MKFVLDFEAAMIAAVRKLSWAPSIHLCLFHLAQSLMRHINDAGLQGKYINDTSCRSRFMNLISLAYLPPAEVPAAFERLSPQFTAMKLASETILSEHILGNWILRPDFVQLPCFPWCCGLFSTKLCAGCPQHQTPTRGTIGCSVRGSSTSSIRPFPCISKLSEGYKLYAMRSQQAFVEAIVEQELLLSASGWKQLSILS